MNKGILCISIDLELLWSRKDLNWKKFIIPTKKERRIITKLLELFDRYHIPATWAIVGKIFENSNRKSPELWSGKDIIKTIIKYKDQEIACHSYTHPEFNLISKKEAEKEILSCVKVAKKWGVNLYSFVFPRNKINHLAILKKYGFICFRSEDASEKELLLPRTPPVYNPKLTSKLVEISSSMYLVSARGLKKFIPQKLRLFKVKMGIDSAIKHKKIFHLWFHPVDLVSNELQFIKCLEEICKYACVKKSTGLLDIQTMKNIAENYLC